MSFFVGFADELVKLSTVLSSTKSWPGFKPGRQLVSSSVNKQLYSDRPKSVKGGSNYRYRVSKDTGETDPLHPFRSVAPGGLGGKTEVPSRATREYVRTLKGYK